MGSIYFLIFIGSIYFRFVLQDFIAWLSCTRPIWVCPKNVENDRALDMSTGHVQDMLCLTPYFLLVSLEDIGDIEDI